MVTTKKRKSDKEVKALCDQVISMVDEGKELHEIYKAIDLNNFTIYGLVSMHKYNKRYVHIPYVPVGNYYDTEEDIYQALSIKTKYNVQ